ncbi:uncharacterized protein LOC107370532 [Tetranychus urticae]|uniref:F-box domain-containing protein n=1 Tax=Tetranychus urticae TaxID=32264 RepID=T1L696_TETUR|nr:uncharacterized protein LOC107370532 [Tetranychus urticae]XP_025018335.1 uncharacterized protein LOC107370532 [Tetranychus urticae]
MLINELPEDCLLTIFDYLNNLDDLINCYKVSIKWSYFISKRTKKVKYLLEGYPENGDCVSYRGTEPIDGTCLSTLFPNLKIAEISDKFARKVKREDIVALLKNQKSLKGLTGGYHKTPSEYCDNLEMLSFDLFKSSMQHNGSSIKQLCQVYHFARFHRYAHCFPNIERINMQNAESHHYGVPVLEKVKIVELCLAPWDGADLDYCSKFMDSCPNLQSAYLVTDPVHLFVDETIKHECLQDLAIEFDLFKKTDWDNLKRFLTKYPNLKHLRFKKIWYLKDEHIEQLVYILPNLVLFDVRECTEVTQRAADYVKDYCKRYGRSIKFYFNGNSHEIATDWPHLSTKKEKISRGFDFMKHCFLKDFADLPHFLVPVDY